MQAGKWVVSHSGREGIREIVRLVLVLFFWYEGWYILVREPAFRAWLAHVPGIGKMAGVVGYGVPCFEILAAGLIVLKPNKGFLVGVALCSVYVVYIGLSLWMTDWFFLPFHPYWQGMRWFDRMLVALVVAWLCLIGVIMKKEPVAGGESDVE